MTVNDLLKTIQTKLQEQKLTIANNMVDGRMSDFESYMKAVGVAEGIEQSISIIDDIRKNFDIEDE